MSLEEALAELAEVNYELGIPGEIRVSRKGVPHLVINNYWSIVWKKSIARFSIFKAYARPDNQCIARRARVEDVIDYMRDKLHWPEGVKNG